MNFKMPEDFKKAYQKELENYQISLKEKNLVQAWKFLERAHVIGQYHPIPHTGIHFRMLVFGIRTFNGKEIFGQLIRVLFGWIGSLLNRIPVGNTGGVSVPIFASMPIPDDLKSLLKDADTDRIGLSGLKTK
ncbi:DUF3703 domain-containing protein [Leptospira bandrabouensis]|uniref:DUF3703 domain-containing protein n=1 Tax=Leptospira bandrabouensis TaxID=2484903 RepID=A0A6H3NUG2_9LEPT|nr:DUF3703 domain-containing protein [Leptospira bandrabouensis]MCG6151549.1 DUF3703 domain-containing protein [Leptospira bandrabouensis]TGN04684.1 DUF3703 domain-containing protein [Leptospira bandrabouensis]TGN15013.1 DUF3703 domain-containing protein [Leptospira bandrabouensis]